MKRYQTRALSTAGGFRAPASITARWSHSDRRHRIRPRPKFRSYFLFLRILAFQDVFDTCFISKFREYANDSDREVLVSSVGAWFELFQLTISEVVYSQIYLCRWKRPGMLLRSSYMWLFVSKMVNRFF